MNVEFINPFVDATVAVFGTMLGAKVQRVGLALADRIKAEYDITGIIGLSGRASGDVVISFERDVALRHEIAAFRGALDVLDAALRDGDGRTLSAMLESAAQDASFVSFAAGLSELRICKDEAEIDFMQQAAVIAEGAFEAIQSSIIPGITEKELASELTMQLYRHGSDTELPFQLHVSSG